MNATQFIHINSWLVQNCDQPVDPDHLSEYLTHSFWPNTKIRSQRWQYMLNELEPVLIDEDRELVKPSTISENWMNYFSLVHEIILAESLTRVWMAVAATKTDDQDVSDISNHVIAENQNFRNRVFKFLNSVPERVQHLADRTSELLALSEKATDLMLSQLSDQEVSRTFSFHKHAFDEFANCANGYNNDVVRQANIALCLSFANGISDLASKVSFNEDVNQKIVNSITRFVENESEILTAETV